jgi:hypothetical protein
LHCAERMNNVFIEGWVSSHFSAWHVVLRFTWPVLVLWKTVACVGMNEFRDHRHTQNVFWHLCEIHCLTSSAGCQWAVVVSTPLLVLPRCDCRKVYNEHTLLLLLMMMMMIIFFWQNTSELSTIIYWPSWCST